MTRAWPAGTPAATLGDAMVLAAWPVERADPDDPVPWPDDPPAEADSTGADSTRRRVWLGVGITSGLAALVALAAGLALLLG